MKARRSFIYQVSCITLGLLTAFTATAQAGQMDYLLRRVVNDKGKVASALKLPNPLKKHSESFKPGLGELLTRMCEKDPVFRRTHYAFLRWVDKQNTKMAEAGCGRFRLPTLVRGAEHFANAIKAMGGETKMKKKANDFGITWNTIFAKARDFARSAIYREGLDLTEGEQTSLANLLALGSIAALCNRVLPADYCEEFWAKHPNQPPVPDTPPEGSKIPTLLWKGIKDTLPWMYHVGAMPWHDPSTKNQHDFYDTLHFFSHAWTVRYNLYRNRFYKRRWGKTIFEERKIGPMAIRKQLAYADTIGFGYECMSTALHAGFRDVTETEDLKPGPLKRLCRFLHIKGVPVVEAFRDMRLNHAGATFGACTAVTDTPLAPLDIATPKSILERFLDGGDL